MQSRFDLGRVLAHYGRSLHHWFLPPRTADQLTATRLPCHFAVGIHDFAAPDCYDWPARHIPAGITENPVPDRMSSSRIGRRAFWSQSTTSASEPTAMVPFRG